MFNPGNIRYQRVVKALSYYACAFGGMHVMFWDFGSQEHVFSAPQRYLASKLDKFYDIKESDLTDSPSKSPSKDWIKMTRIDKK